MELSFLRKGVRIKKVIQGISLIKLNIGLSVIGFTNNNKCLLDTILVKSNRLIDKISIYENNEKEDVIEEKYGNQLFYRKLQRHHNSFIALKRIKKLTGNKKFYKVLIEKSIPLGSGLGGVSGNVAFIMKQLNKLSHHPLPSYILIKEAAKISLDAAFFTTGLSVGRGIGIGDTHTPLDFNIMDYLKIELILFPIPLSTESVYSHYKKFFSSGGSFIDKVIIAIKQKNIQKLKKVLRNDLAKSIYEIAPELKNKFRLYQQENSALVFTGAGSSLLRISLNKPSIKTRLGKIR